MSETSLGEIKPGETEEEEKDETLLNKSLDISTLRGFQVANGEISGFGFRVSSEAIKFGEEKVIGGRRR